MRGNKNEFMDSKPEPILEYLVANVVANGWLNIEDDDNLIYWVKGRISLSVLVFNKKAENQLIMYL